MVKLTWEQVLAWRVRRGFLEPRTDQAVGPIVSRLCGVQAQVASSAELAVGVRQAKPGPGGIEGGLAAKSLVKTWVMRGTLHAMPTAGAPAYLSLVASARSWEKGAWQRAFGASPSEMAALKDLVAELLHGRLMTRDELVASITARREFSHLEEALRSGWGAVLKPLSWQGALCFGANEGKKVRFTNPASLLPDWSEPPEPEVAASSVIASYLGAYGPATPAVFDAWLTRGASKKGTLRSWFAAMGDRLVEVDVEGTAASLLAEHVDEIAAIEPSNEVRLLGGFDPYVLGPGTKCAPMLKPEHRSRVSRAAGWISPVVVAGGRIIGVWEREGGEVTVSLFPGEQAPRQSVLDREVAHLAAACGLERLGIRVT
ncbi:MAG: winged helix DNA-binding domain-containing protein [Acidobacteriota bacterium]